MTYRQKFDYDRFGNLYRKQDKNPNSLSAAWIEDSTISKTTNRLTTGTTYDDAGNVVQDTKFRNLNYWYDANGRMYKTASATSANQSNSVYDASGNRVATQIDGVWTFFIYDAFGKKVCEYGGLQATDEGGIRYVFSDWQGSTRLITRDGGTVQARMDYTAFGEEIQANVGQRTSAQGYAAANTLDQKYALTERDKATGLDHTWFRKLEQVAGRWTSPDPYNGSMNLGSPQSFNRYSYVENQPTNFIDPSGLNMQAPGKGCGQWMTDKYGDRYWVPCASATVTVSGGRDPFTLTGSAALLYLWNPTGRGSGGNNGGGIDVGGGRSGISVNNRNQENQQVKKDPVKAAKEKCDKTFERKKKKLLATYGTALIIAGIIAVITWETVIGAIASGIAAIGIAITWAIEYGDIKAERDECYEDAEKPK